MSPTVQHLQAEIATDAVILVHHRRTDGEFGEIAHHVLGIATAALRRRCCKARSPNNCGSAMMASGGSVSTKPCSSGATVMPRRASPARKAGQPVDRFRWISLPRSRSSSASRRPADLGGEQHAPVEAGEKMLQCGRRVRAAAIDGQVAAVPRWRR